LAYSFNNPSILISLFRYSTYKPKNFSGKCKIKKLLSRQPGEIQLRIMRTRSGMGIATVAVYSEADREIPHECKDFADEALFCLAHHPPLSALSIRR